MDRLRLDADLDGLRERARRCYRRRVRAAICVAVVVLIAFVVFVPHPPTPRPSRDAGLWANVVDGVVIASLLAYVTFVFVRFRHGSWQPNKLVRPSVVLGLPRAQRRRATRDIRRGTPSNDPHLCVIEQAEVDRLRPLLTMLSWSAPAMIVFFTFVGAHNIMRDHHGGWFGVAAAVAVATTTAWSAPYVRGMRAFP